MALSVLDYLHPRGDLKVEVLWPRLSNETKAQRDARAEEIVGVYRTQAYQKTGSDEATRHWVNYRAWSEKADDLNAIPASASVEGEGSRAYLQAQIEYWTAKAASALEAFEDVVSEATGVGGDYGVITSLR